MTAANPVAFKFSQWLDAHNRDDDGDDDDYSPNEPGHDDDGCPTTRPLSPPRDRALRRREAAHRALASSPDPEPTPDMPCGFAHRPNTIGPHQKQRGVAAYQRMAHWTTVPEV